MVWEWEAVVLAVAGMLEQGNAGVVAVRIQEAGVVDAQVGLGVVGIVVAVDVGEDVGIAAAERSRVAVVAGGDLVDI